ncbi:MAG: hypothetical protein RLZZ458_1013 [Planctomycetota bacterium]
MEAGMASLYKKPVILNDPKTDKPVKTKSRKWWGQLNDETGVERRVPLAVDKAVAQSMLNHYLRAIKKFSRWLVCGCRTGEPPGLHLNAECGH